MASSSSISDAVRLAALGTGIGQTTCVQCPRCARTSLYVTRTTAQSIGYMCHRASCGLRGYVQSKADAQSAPTKTTKRVPEVHSSKLPDDVHAWLCSRYTLEPETIKDEGLSWWAEKGRVLSPVYGLTGQLYGYSARAVQSGFTGPKSLTVVQDTRWPGGLFTRTSYDSSVLIVVEDPFSAYAAAEYGYRGCALLGVSVTDDLEPLFSAFEEVVVALDNDATDKAARLVHRLSYLNVRQLVLEKDIKDMSLVERSAVLGSY